MGGRIISRTTHLRQIFIYIFIQLLHYYFISSHGRMGWAAPLPLTSTHTHMKSSNPGAGGRVRTVSVTCDTAEPLIFCAERNRTQ